MKLRFYRNVLGQLEKLLFVTLFNLEGTGPWERCGDIAQLGERLPCKQEVAGSIPTISTTSKQTAYPSLPGKPESSLIPLLLLSKSNPLRWASIWVKRRTINRGP